MAGMLYYPLINPPAAVLNQALLYWDHIATIVPPGDADPYLNRQLREVDQAGLYRPIDGSRWFTPHIGIEAGEVLSQLKSDAPISDIDPDEQPALSARAGIYNSKLGYSLVEELRRRKMATTTDDARRIIVTPLVQTCLLGLVAREVSSASTREHGCTARESLIPHTDSSATYEMAYQPLRRTARRRSDRPDHLRRAACFTIDLGSLLPVPRDDVLISDLLAFRHQYDDERQRLLLVLDRMVHALQRDYEHPDDVLRQMSRELLEARDDVVDASKSRRITWTRRSIALTVAVGSSYGAGALHTAWAWLLGVAGGMAGNVATSGELRRSAARQAPLSYLHRVEGAIKSSGLPKRTVRRPS
jgi:hypothetical protein